VLQKAVRPTRRNSKGLGVNFLDIPTAYLIVGFLFLIAPASGWLVLGTGPSRTVALWCGGGLLFGLGMLLIGGRPVLPVWLSYTVASVLTVLGLGMKIGALKLENGGRRALPWLVPLALLHGAVFEWLRIGGRPDWRFAWGALCIAGLFALIGALAFRLAARQKSRSAFWLGLVYLVGSAHVGLRGLGALAGWFDPDAVSPSLSSVLTAVLGLLLSIVGTMGFIGIFLDQSRLEAVQAEAERVRRHEALRLGGQIARMERLHVMNELSGTLAHELNQPLAATLTNAQLARHIVLQPDGRRESLSVLMDDIERDTRRASDILQRVRGFVRPGGDPHEIVDLRRTAQEVLDLLSSETRAAGVAVHVDLPIDPVNVTGDAVQLAQIVLNLVRNALQASPPHSHSAIALRLWSEQNTAVLTVRDHGAGIEPQHLPQVGTPFFTTKSEGTGLGLTIARALAQQHKASLVLRNAPDGGALAQLRLPCLNTPAARQ